MPYRKIEEIRVDEAFSKKLPDPPKAEFEALVADVEEHGIVVDLLVSGDGLLLDGHRRLQAAKEANLPTVPVKVIDAVRASSCAQGLAIAVNLSRRHLNAAQRAEPWLKPSSYREGAGKEEAA